MLFELDRWACRLMGDQATPRAGGLVRRRREELEIIWRGRDLIRMHLIHGIEAWPSLRRAATGE